MATPTRARTCRSCSPARRRRDQARAADQLKEKTPLCNLYLTMMQCLGVEIDRFADSTGVIRELAGA